MISGTMNIILIEETLWSVGSIRTAMTAAFVFATMTPTLYRAVAEVGWFVASSAAKAGLEYAASKIKKAVQDKKDAARAEVDAVAAEDREDGFCHVTDSRTGKAGGCCAHAPPPTVIQIIVSRETPETARELVQQLYADAPAAIRKHALKDCDRMNAMTRSACEVALLDDSEGEEDDGAALEKEAADMAASLECSREEAPDPTIEDDEVMLRRRASPGNLLLHDQLEDCTCAGAAACAACELAAWDIVSEGSAE
jgi:hypothetical protein